MNIICCPVTVSMISGSEVSFFLVDLKEESKCLFGDSLVFLMVFFHLV